LTQLDRWRRDFGAPQQRRGHLLGLSGPAVYRARNLSENLFVALDQKFGLAKITPPEAGLRCRRLRTGSKFVSIFSIRKITALANTIGKRQ
jgi:hypothetical protein